ncbi:S8 family serine peptidase [Candidatus Zixiibacteriota bacterium]
MNRWIFLTAVLLALLFAAYGAQAAEVITPQLTERMALAEPDELIRINIVMAQRPDPAQLRVGTKGLYKLEKRQLVIDRLRQLADESQAGVLSLLERAQVDGKVTRLGSLWLGNAIFCSATREIIQQVAAMGNIRSVDWDEFRPMLHYTREDAREADVFKLVKKERAAHAGEMSTMVEASSETGAKLLSKEIVWNLTKINADDVWGLGYTGDGVLVANLDTGVNYNHLDLQDHMWDGSAFGLYNHGFNFVNGTSDPMDDDSTSPGHGTHTAGTIAGDGTAGSQVGVAPDAIIIACKILDGAGLGTEADTWWAMQSAVLFGADVLSMSAGWVHEWDPDLCTWREECDNLLALDIVFCTSAGNGRPYPPYGHFTIPDDISTPADVPAPWYPLPNPGDEHHSSILAIGAVTSSDVVCSFSSYGPTEWDTTCTDPDHDYDDYPYPPGLIKPDLCAPGQYIKSLAHDDNSGYRGPLGWAGTSMACPHVAGTVALMLEKNPDLTAVEIDSILETTSVDLGSAGRDNYYGGGRIDALAAVNATPEAGQPPVAIADLEAALTNGAKSSSGDIYLAWSEPVSDLGVDYYVIYRTTDPGSTMDSLNSTADTSYTDSGAAGDTLTNYFYTVKAVDQGGQKASDSNMVGEFERYLKTAP